ncbi:MAG: hypothetical protein JWQ04_2931 [Pedosphaera sp.]|nr:hypothetical protein [Pedosphaera sp.]
MKNKPINILATLACGLLSLPHPAVADTIFTINNNTADAFLATGSAGNPVGTDLTSLNFGGVGTLAIAPASSTKGEFDSIIKFNLAGAVSQFNSTYGVGNWQITGLTLKLASSFGTQGTQPGNNLFNTINAGSFALRWLSYDSWVEGTGGGNSSVSFNSIATLFSGTHDSLGAFTYTPPGNNVYVSYTLPLDAGLVTDATAGGDVSLYFSPNDNQIGYLFNSRSFAGNTPEFMVQAGAVPEPSTVALLAMSFSVFLFARKIIH